MSNTILAIDIGSTKVAALIAQRDDEEALVVTGSGVTKTQGLKKGVITNIDLATKSIKEAYEDANRISGTSPKKAIVSISGAYVKGTNSTGIVNIPNKEISIDEINRVMQTALYNANIPHEYEVVHVLPYKFKVDGQDFIEDPLGMNASRLEVDVHIIAAPKSSISNLKKAVQQAGLQIESIVLSGYASAIATLNEDEKELGACVIDMGGSTCNLVIHAGNSIVYNDFLAVGSMHITNDLSMALHTPLSVAEEIKLLYGNIKNAQAEAIEIPSIGEEGNTHQVSLEIVYNVIYARVEETLMILAQSIEKSGLKDQIGGGIVLTGGMTKLGGIRELANAIFDHMPTRIAKPRALQGMPKEWNDPAFASVVGLALYGNGEFTPYEIDSNRRLRYSKELISINEMPHFSNEEQHDISAPTAKEDLLNLEEMESFEEKKKKKSISGFFKWLTQLF
ncbi:MULTISPECIES: cell division protein FtsA [unclassified Nitratiruptor]|uniref:cell division protein FtsA n=1 Tax=unclassified Nitratiruptor TaxID=2624044 RepID=UPI00191517FF|nr:MULTISPECIES: cell division protein FtsA [unclassified Nitratiruptor]BCD60252.1 cell division protein FtsA [Nitratiruptor sp. YY08-10]BCD64259.1 cell division protein FtsA [Nitratiruptor sp. YY08-14]